MQVAYLYFTFALGGLETEKQYPYESRGEKCAFNPSLAKVKINGAVNISSNEDGT